MERVSYPRYVERQLCRESTLVEGGSDHSEDVATWVSVRLTPGGGTGELYVLPGHELYLACGLTEEGGKVRLAWEEWLASLGYGRSFIEGIGSTLGQEASILRVWDMSLNPFESLSAPQPEGWSEPLLEEIDRLYADFMAQHQPLEVEPQRLSALAPYRVRPEDLQGPTWEEVAALHWAPDAPRTQLPASIPHLLALGCGVQSVTSSLLVLSEGGSQGEYTSAYLIRPPRASELPARLFAQTVSKGGVSGLARA